LPGAVNTSLARVLATCSHDTQHHKLMIRRNYTAAPWGRAIKGDSCHTIWIQELMKVKNQTDHDVQELGQSHAVHVKKPEPVTTDSQLHPAIQQLTAA
jgi:hypothetical protein